MKIRTLIVDDMELARDRIKRHLAEDAEIEIVGECANGREAIAAIKNLAPDLVFLDVQMPVIDGFEVVETIGAANMPLIIFVTANDEFASRAFALNALDYILKPFGEERLTSGVTHAKRQMKAAQNERQQLNQ
ncbi:MAG TPA: response regulator [Pyrinomonadaceae bacterium]|jgi:two-component system LytT family response regulator